jgi:hydroxymethylbilane synthase
VAAALRLATRGSALARAQARIAAQALSSAGAGELTEIVIRTTGDRRPDAPLEQLEGQGWFVAELEQALLDGRADAAVHSAKDLPSALGPGLDIAAYLPRADPRDVAVTRGGVPLASLPEGAAVGTSSTRRAAFLLAMHPQLRPVPIRGNVDTRLRKLDAGEADGLVLAAAGLQRLGSSRPVEHLDPSVFVPAPAQGAVALETLSGSATALLCAGVDDAPTRAAATAERAVLEALGGGCLLPLGAWARIEDGRLALSAALAVEGEIRRAELTGTPEEAADLGRRVAAQLR